MRRGAGAGLLAAVALLAGCFQAEAPRPAAQSPRADAATSSSARAQAVTELVEESGARAVPALTSIALNDPDATVRREAVYSLADVGDTADYSVIEQALMDPEPRVREAAIEALAGLGGEDSAAMLAVALNDADPRIRLDAVDALGEVGGTTAALALRQAVNDSDPAVRAAASEALEELAVNQP